MRDSARDLTHPRSRRQPAAGSTVHAARRPRRAHSSRSRFGRALGASLALAVLGYFATTKALEFTALSDWGQILR